LEKTEKTLSQNSSVGARQIAAENAFFFQESKATEANKVFPTDAESAYLSSYFTDSYIFPYNPDPLVNGNSYRIYDEMRHDDQVKSALSFKKDLILSPGWEIKCKKKEIKETLENNLREEMGSCSFEDSLRDIMSAYDYGFSLTEVLYKKPENGVIKIRDIKTRPPHTFEFHLTEIGDVEKIVQRQSAGSKDFKPSYFLHFTYQPEFGNPYGKSDLRAAHQAWKTKKFFLRFWAIYVERFAAPTILGEYPDDYDSAKVSRLQAVLKTIQNSTVAVMPEGTKIDFKMPQRDSSDIYEKGVTLLNTMIARALLMPDLLGISGEQTSGGSYALGSTQFRMFMELIKKEQNALARKVTQHVLRPLVLANWGDYPCSLVFKDFSEGDMNEALKIWVDATRSNLWQPNDEEVNHLREMLKFPVGDVKAKPIQPVQSPGQPGRTPGNGDNPDMPEAEKARLNAAMLPVLHFREKTLYEKKIDFALISEAFQKIEASVTPKIRSAAKDIWTDYLDQVKDRSLLSRFRPEAITTLAVRFQKPMNVEMKAFMRDAYLRAYAMAQKEMFPSIERKMSMTEELLPEEFLSVIEAEAFKLVGDYSVNITNKMRNQLIQGIKNGMNERDLLSDLRDLGKYESDKWIETVIRTKATEMFNRARKSYWDNDELASQIVEAYQFSSILDDRTSEVCRFMDGKIFTKDDFITRATPPLHFNCRSILVPVTKFEDYELDKSPTIDKLKDLGGNLIV
jgi:SPP1 gp7 family putative phage head morphogenesis protein